MIYDLQKASMWKRISAFLFDAIILGIVAVLMGWLISAVTGFDGWTAKLEESYVRYGEMYSVNLNLSFSDYEQMTAEQMENLNAAYDALSADPQAREAHGMVVSLTMMIVSLGLLMGFLLMEFAVPLLLGNGQTLGKKIFGIALMQQEGIRVNGRVMFVRALLGKYTLETMVPVFILIMIFFGMLGIEGTLVLIGLLILQGGMLAFTKKRLTIHDALAATVAVDLQSQMIFEDRAALLAYKEKVHAEKAARQAY